MWDIQRSNQGYLEIKGPLNRKELVPSLRRTPIETIRLPLSPQVTFFDGNLIWVFCRGEVYGFDPDTNENVTISSDSFANSVEAISCDGNFLWIPYDQKLIFLDKSQHTIDQVLSYSTRSYRDIVFDGHQMWMTISNRIEVWRAATRNKVFELSMEESTRNLEFDGKYIWVSANGGDSRVVRKINAWTRLIEADFYFDEIVNELVFDGHRIWVHNGDKLTSIDPTNNSIETNLGFIIGTGCKGLLYDGFSIWVGSSRATLQRIDTRRGRYGLPPDYYGTGVNAPSLAFDGTHIWVISIMKRTVSKIPVAPIQYLISYTQPL